MASEFLKKKAQEQRTEREKKYGDVYLAANNPAYVYLKTYGDGKTGKEANKAVKGASSGKETIERSTDALLRNNPGYVYLQKAGGGKTITKGSDALTLGKTSKTKSEQKAGQIHALGAGDMTIPRALTTRSMPPF